MTEAEILGKLNLGSSKAILNNTAGNPMSALLLKLTQDVIDDLRKAIAARDIDASRNLSQGIKPTKVIYNGKAVSVGIEMDFYWKYVNYGVNGTLVNHGAPNWGEAAASGKSFNDSIIEWMSFRGITKGDFETLEDKASFIQMRIVQKGKKPRPFFEDVINDQLIKVLKKPIGKLLGKSIKINIISPWR